MAVGESVNTALQNSFIKFGDGDYGLKVSSIPYPGQTSSGVNGESGFGTGSVAAPAAGAVIATHTPPGASAGFLHEIEITAWLSVGAPAAADNFNIAFKFGGTVISNIPLTPSLNQPVKTKFYFKAAAGTAFAVVAVGAATAGVTYNALITATKLVS